MNENVDDQHLENRACSKLLKNSLLSNLNLAIIFDFIINLLSELSGRKLSDIISLGLKPLITVQKIVKNLLKKL